MSCNGLLHDDTCECTREAVRVKLRLAEARIAELEAEVESLHKVLFHERDMSNKDRVDMLNRQAQVKLLEEQASRDAERIADLEECLRQSRYASQVAITELSKHAERVSQLEKDNAQLGKNVQTWMEESFAWGRKSREDRAESHKLKTLILLTDPAVSSEVMNELSMKQWTEFERWKQSRQVTQESYPLIKGSAGLGEGGGEIQVKILGKEPNEAGSLAASTTQQACPHEYMAGRDCLKCSFTDSEIRNDAADAATAKVLSHTVQGSQQMAPEPHVHYAVAGCPCMPCLELYQKASRQQAAQDTYKPSGTVNSQATMTAEDLTRVQNELTQASQRIIADMNDPTKCVCGPKGKCLKHEEYTNDV